MMVWRSSQDEPSQAPVDRPLTVMIAGYEGGGGTGAGRDLPDAGVPMPPTTWAPVANVVEVPAAMV